ncbi:MAG: cytochrome c oxidase subunit 2 [Candidatus Azotimanducaceae bacterium]|jgi:cytochrome c oxidase subunit 2
MLIAAVLVLLVLGSIAFHFISPWWFTPIASNWGTIDDTIEITFWVTGAVFIAVNMFMAFALVRYRNRGPDSKRAHYEPENKKLEIWLTGLTAIGVAAILAPGLYVWSDFVNVPEDAWEFEVVGEQWRWTFRLPGDDGYLGTSSSSLVSISNPLGVNPSDSNGQDDLIVMSNVMHLPIDKPVKMLLRSKDVLHDFAVAEFRVKMDLVPGLVTYLWLTPTRTGTFDILCEELCGLGHFTMRGRVVVDTQEDYDAWRDSLMTFKAMSEIDAGDPLIGQATYPVCATCHGFKGEGIAALNSPKLSGQEGWYLQTQLRNFKKGVRGSHQDDEYGRQMAPMAAILADEAAIRNMAAYITTLPEHTSVTSLSGDVAKGQHLYRTCGTCHGLNGEGNYATNSPRLRGQEDWYLKRQLENFKNGVRGAHRQDLFGPQMRSMSRMLRTENDINNVVAYINTLEPAVDLNQIADAAMHGGGD